jgi:mono/diheme cytochrome c family protein
MPDLIASAQGELLTQAVQLARIHDIQLPDELSRDLLMDESQPMSLRVHSLRYLLDSNAIQYGLESDHWELRAAARDVKVDREFEGILDEVLKVVHESPFPEAQAAIRSLARISDGIFKLNIDDLAPELHLDYWEATGNVSAYPDPLEGNWLEVGGSVYEGKRIVFEHSASQCLRCHKVGNTGGIAGPALHGVGSMLSDRELLEALLIPNKRIAEGFGEASAMPPVRGVLDNREIRDVIAYLKSL